MKTYIDAEKLKERIIKLESESCICEEVDGFDDGIGCVLNVIDSLQQEQPEVDLEKEVDRFLKSEESTTYENAGSYKVAVKDPKKIARHFYELGKNARKEE